MSVKSSHTGAGRGLSYRSSWYDALNGFSVYGDWCWRILRLSMLDCTHFGCRLLRFRRTSAVNWVNVIRVPVAALPAGDCCDFVSQYSVWLLGGLIIGPIIKNRHYNTL